MLRRCHVRPFRAAASTHGAAGRTGGTGAAPSFSRGDLRADHARGTTASGAHAGGDIRRVDPHFSDPANDDPAGDDPHRDTSFRGGFTGDDRHNNHRHNLRRRARTRGNLLRDRHDPGRYNGPRQPRGLAPDGQP